MTGVAHSIWWLTTGWTVRGSIPSRRVVFHAVQTARTLTQPPLQRITVSTGNKAAGAWR